MNIETMRGVLLWCSVINYGLLLFWVALFFAARATLHRFARGFHLSSEQFDVIQYAGMLLYKLAILLFNIVPYIALSLAK